MPLAGNPNIAQSVKERSFARPLIDLAEKQRVDEVTRSNLATAAQQRQIGEQTIQQNEMGLEQAQRSLDANAMLSITHDMETMKGLLESGQVKTAGQVGMGIRQRLIEAGEPTEGFDGILANMKDSPEGGIQYLTEALAELTPKVESLMIASGKVPEKGDDFTLAGGAKRFDDQGNLIAENIPAGETFRTETRQGHPVQVSSLTNREFASPRAGEVSESVSNREAKIQDLMAQTNPQTSAPFTRAEASNITDNLIRTELVEGVGPRSIDELSRTVTEVPLTGGSTPAPGPSEGGTIFEAIQKGTGLGSSVSATISEVGGQFGASIDEEVLQARATLEQAINPLVESLRITTRLPAQEVQRISEMANLEPGAFRSPGAMEAQAIALDRNLRVKLAQAQAEASDTSLADSQRQSASADASAIQNFLVQLGAPEDLDPSIITINTVDTFDFRDLVRFRSTITAEQAESIPQDAWDALIARLNSGR